MLLLIDNYDSFTYNLYQELSMLGAEVRVVRNDEVSINDIEKMTIDRIIISPGPCTPNEAGISVDVIKHFAGRIPILGVCLGHQCIGVAFGGKVVRAGRLMHGKTSMITHDGKGVYKGLPNPFEAMRYHSLLVDVDSLPDVLIPTAWSEQDELMGIRHKKYPIEGVQFHPESIMTPCGMDLLKNFLNLHSA